MQFANMKYHILENGRETKSIRILTQCIIHRRQLVLRVPSIGGFRHAEREGEIETLDQTVSEVVALDHAEVPDLLPSNFELEPVFRKRRERNGE